MFRVDMKELNLIVNYLPWNLADGRAIENAFKSALSQVSHLSTFQFMAQEDFKVSVKMEIYRIVPAQLNQQ